MSPFDPIGEFVPSSVLCIYSEVYVLSCLCLPFTVGFRNVGHGNFGFEDGERTGGRGGWLVPVSVYSSRERRRERERESRAF